MILHGWGSSCENWQQVQRLLEEKDVKVVVPDLPGFGKNSPLSEVWSVDDYVDWVKEYCDKNNLSQIFLLGHSFGGGLAVEFSSRFPEKVKKLILTDPAIIRVKHFKRGLLAKIVKVFKIFSFLPFYKLTRRILYKFIASDYPGLEGAMRQTYLNVVKKDLSDCLGAVSVSTLLIWGEKDKITPFKDAQTIKEKISGARLEVLPDIRHNPHQEAPEILVEKVLNFIKP